MVQAFAEPMSKYDLNNMSVPIIIGIAMMTIRHAIRVSTIYFFGLLNAFLSRFSSFGSIARATSKNPSVTRLSQII